MEFLLTNGAAGGSADPNATLIADSGNQAA
jgi:hypothetical protein